MSKGSADIAMGRDVPVVGRPCGGIAVAFTLNARAALRRQETFHRTAEEDRQPAPPLHAKSGPSARRPQ